jgi:deoxyribose-phosphate aldolase
MTDQEILSRVDHTLLKAAATWEEITNLCDEAMCYKTASVCIPPVYVQPVFAEYGSDLVICTVIGFPLGYTLSAVKTFEAEQAIAKGASEIDMVINIAGVKNGAFAAVLDEIKAVKKVCGERILKVIVETCYLSEEEKRQLCGIVTEAGADFIKTSTGFGSAGALLDDIHLFMEHIGPGVKIKAAGGIKTREDLEAFISAGASRIGTSSAVKLLADGVSEGY